MRRALPYAAGTLVSVALLGFALRHGLDAATGDQLDEWPGWQVTATRWTLVGAALVLGLLVAVFAFRRMRRLEGEGVLLGVPLLLGGLLLSAVPALGAEAAETYAGKHTDAARSFAAEQAAALAEEKVRPLRFPSSKPAAPPSLAELVPHAGDLGAGWYDAQRPAVVQVSGKDGVPVTSTILTQATRIPSGWDFDRTLFVRMADYSTAAAARAAGHVVPDPNAVYGTHPVGKLVFSTLLAPTPLGRSVKATLVLGTRVWTVLLSSGQPNEPLSDGEIDQVLQAVARRAAA